jgi:hypothetical protein
MGDQEHKTFLELLEESERRRAERRRFTPVDFRPRNIPRRVQLERDCICHACTHAHCYGEF